MAAPESSNGIEEAPTSSTPTPPAELDSSSTATSSSPAKPIDPKNLGVNFLLQGKRHLVTKDLSGAIESLGEACRLLTDVEPSDEHYFDRAEAHFFYGKALLEQSRLELGVLEGVPDQPGKEESGEESEEEEEEDSEEEEEKSPPAEEPREAECTSNGSGEPSEAKKPASGDEPCVSSSNDTDVDLAAPSPTDAPVAGSSSSNGGIVVDSEQPSTSSAEIPEDELSNLELAWQVTELAKNGYARLLEVGSKSEEAGKKDELSRRLADAHGILGEVATESEMYTQAVEEFQTGLDIMLKIDADSREIAQYYFQMGLAYSFDKRFPEAITVFKKSVEVIEKKIETLRTKIAAKTAGDEDKSEENEVQELTALLPELQEKIQDTIDAEKDSQKMEQEEEQEKEIIARNSPVKNPNPANNINHLVKKKKKAEEAPENERPVKKMCVEGAAAPGENGKTEEKSNGESAPATQEKNGIKEVVQA